MVDNLLAEQRSGTVGDRPHDVFMHLDNVHAGAAFEILIALAADNHQVDLLEVFLIFADEAFRCLADICVEPAAQTAIRRHQDNERPFFFPLQQQRVRLGILAHGQAGKHVRHFVRVGACRHHRILCSAQLGRGHHFHRLGNLAGVLDRADSFLDFL